MSNISILGCGWLGLSLGNFLVKKGHTVFGSTTRVEKFADLKAVGIRPFLIKLPNEIDEVVTLDFFQTDVLILNIPPGRRHPNVEEHHFQQVEKVVEMLTKGTIQKVIFVSSTGVYADVNRVVTEADALHPTRGSGKALVRVEQFLQSQANFQTTIVRMGGLVGGNRKAGRFLAGKKDVKNGAAPINMIHREDCIGVIDAVLKQEIWGETFNVSADEHPTRKEFYLAQTKKQGLDAPTFLDDGEVSFKIVSNKKVKAILGYAFLHPDPMEF
ncbi:MAG: nucleoside-diphosphate-sugar epimerase [Paraglaciecola sp.]|jgi:nucleoside-diphosphate-sugar epimerase